MNRRVDRIGSDTQQGDRRLPVTARLKFYVLQLKKESVHVVVE